MRTLLVVDRWTRIAYSRTGFHATSYQSPETTLAEGLTPAQLHSLGTLCTDLTEAAGLPTLVARLARGLVPLMPFDQVALGMRAPDGRLWGLVRPRYADDAEPTWMELSDPGSPIEEAFQGDRPVVRDSRGTSLMPPGNGASTAVRELSLFPFAIAVPVHGPDGALGALGVFSGTSGAYSMSDLHVLSTVGSVVAATARKLVLLEELGRAERDQQRMERLRQELVEQLHVNLGNALNVVCNGLDFMQSALLPPDATETREQVDELRLVAGTSVDMVENLVQLARIDDGTLALSPAPVAVDALLRERVALRSSAARTNEVQVIVRCEPADAQSNLDAELASRVVDTLLVNAIRHTPRRGQVAVVAVARADMLTVAVADTGAPIASADREALLERGPRGDDKEPPSRRFGLAFANAAVTYLGGSLSIETTANAGNIFRIALPQ